MQGTLGVLPLSGDGKPYPFLNSGFSEIPATFSPDGKWVAFVSNQSADRREIFVTGFPQPAGVWQVSTSGGDFPRWRHDGKELFFLGPDKLMAAQSALKEDRSRLATSGRCSTCGGRRVHARCTTSHPMDVS